MRKTRDDLVRIAETIAETAESKAPLSDSVAEAPSTTTSAADETEPPGRSTPSPLAMTTEEEDALFAWVQEASKFNQAAFFAPATPGFIRDYQPVGDITPDNLQRVVLRMERDLSAIDEFFDNSAVARVYVSRENYFDLVVPASFLRRRVATLIEFIFSKSKYDPDVLVEDVKTTAKAVNSLYEAAEIFIGMTPPSTMQARQMPKE